MHGSREIPLVPSLHRASTDALIPIEFNTLIVLYNACMKVQVLCLWVILVRSGHALDNE